MEEVARFVADNARRVLGVDAAKVLAVSARDALAAKLAAGAGANGAPCARPGSLTEQRCPALRLRRQQRCPALEGLANQGR